MKEVNIGTMIVKCEDMKERCVGVECLLLETIPVAAIRVEEVLERA